MNVYGYSKFLFDEYVRQILPEANSQIVGFRYFNVYGPREGHKGSMASVAFHLNTQLNNGESPKLFEGSENFKRDFVYVGDVADVNLWFWKMAFPASSTSVLVVRNPSGGSRCYACLSQERPNRIHSVPG